MKKIVSFAICIWLATCAYGQQPLLVLSDTDVRDIFNTIFDNTKANSIQTITQEDKQKALLFMRELIDKSCDVGLIHGILKTSYKLRPNLKKIAKVLVKHTITDCDQDKYYVSVRNTIAWKFKSAYEIRLQTGDW